MSIMLSRKGSFFLSSGISPEVPVWIIDISGRTKKNGANGNPFATKCHSL